MANEIRDLWAAERLEMLTEPCGFFNCIAGYHHPTCKYGKMITVGIGAIKFMAFDLEPEFDNSEEW